MKSKTVSVLTILAITLVISAAAYAKSGRDITLFHDASLAGSHLASGKYHVQWVTHSPEATVTFQQGKDVLATAQGKVVDRGKKYTANEVVTAENSDGATVIKEIRFSGSSEVIVFD
jgi:hypothetical protein